MSCRGASPPCRPSLRLKFPACLSRRRVSGWQRYAVIFLPALRLAPAAMPGDGGIAGRLPSLVLGLRRALSPAFRGAGRAIRSGDAARVAALNAQLAPLWRCFDRYGGSLRVIASAAAILGLCDPDCLPRPLLPLGRRRPFATWRRRCTGLMGMEGGLPRLVASVGNSYCRARFYHASL